MNTELKQLIEDAAKMLGIRDYNWLGDHYHYFPSHYFNPLDPKRGDLLKVAEAAELVIDVREGENAVYWEDPYAESPCREGFTKGDHQSLALAVLRAASAVLKSRGK